MTGKVAFRSYTQRQPAGKKPLPPVERLKELFDYDKDKGALIWKAVQPNSMIENGQAAGVVIRRKNQKPSIAVCVDGKAYKLPRLIWRMCTGEDPGSKMSVVHKDGDVFNNRIENLELRGHGQRASVKR